jgi:hypothetical protein
VVTESSGTIIAMACKALQERRCLALSYHGFARIVEVHVVGRTRDDVEIMRVWQVSGGSESGEPTGWKMMTLDAVSAPQVTSQRSLAPRPDYNPDDPVIADVVCKVDYTTLT